MQQILNLNIFNQSFLLLLSSFKMTAAFNQYNSASGKVLGNHIGIRNDGLEFKLTS